MSPNVNFLSMYLMTYVSSSKSIIIDYQQHSINITMLSVTNGDSILKYNDILVFNTGHEGGGTFILTEIRMKIEKNVKYE